MTRMFVALLCLLALSGWATDRLQFKAQGDSAGVGTMRLHARLYKRDTRTYTRTGIGFTQVVTQRLVTVRTPPARRTLIRVGRGTWRLADALYTPYQRGPPSA